MLRFLSTLLLIISLTPQKTTARENVWNRFIASTFYPGLGQLLYDDDKTKGIIMTASTTVSLASFVFFQVKTQQAYYDYLSATSEFSEKYEEVVRYSTARNISLLTLGGVFLWSLIDNIYHLPDTTTISVSHTETNTQLNLKVMW